MKKAVGGIIYSTETAVLIARNGAEDMLYRARNYRYFRVSSLPLCEPELSVLTDDQALFVYNRLAEKLIDYQTAFPFKEFRDA